MKQRRQTQIHESRESFRRGVVERIEQGVIHVRDEQATYSCQFVRTTAAAPPEFKPGDSVLYAVNAASNEAFVLGLVEPYLPKADRLADQLNKTGRAPSTTTVEDEVVRIKAGKGLVIECGQGTIIITQDGKIQVKGNEILSRARGMNKIKGAGIDLN